MGRKPLDHRLSKAASNARTMAVHREAGEPPWGVEQRRWWEIKLEANQISRDWTVLHKGRTFYVDYTQSDGHTLALCNRDNWEVWEKTEDGTEELDVYGFASDGSDGQEEADDNFRLMKKLIRFCIEHWDDRFMTEIEEDLQEQKEALDVMLTSERQWGWGLVDLRQAVLAAL
jgi:hypothetical protein